MELRIEHLSKRYATGVQALDEVPESSCTAFPAKVTM